MKCSGITLKNAMILTELIFSDRDAGKAAMISQVCQHVYKENSRCMSARCVACASGESSVDLAPPSVTVSVV